MPAKQKKTIQCEHFRWKFGRRTNGVWTADGRSNSINLGRHSLGTRDEEEARKLLHLLDREMAIRHGLADAPVANDRTENPNLRLEDGRKLYVDFISRPRVAGGVRASSQKRYRAVFDKFLFFLREQGIAFWNQMSVEILESYARHLERKGYAFRTQYLELTTLIQTMNWLIRRGHLPAECRIALPLRKPSDDSDTYCYRPEEFHAMLDYCRSQPELQWLADVILALGVTGLRISELRNLRWSDVDLEQEMVKLVDESSRKVRGSSAPRTVKGGYSRSFPIHPELDKVLRRIPRHADGFVFHGPEGGRLKPDTVRRSLVRDVIEPLADRFPTSSGSIGFRDGRLHSLRHFFCSLCANRGIPERVVMRWLGHRDSRIDRKSVV